VGRLKNRTVMYDVKTHDAEYVRVNRKLYEQQLNVYAYIWQELRGQPLDETAVIATDFPEGIKQALNSGDEAQLAYELEAKYSIALISAENLVCQVRRFNRVSWQRELMGG
jgi:hypothetical protein